jgi:hypothetical protein
MGREQRARAAASGPILFALEHQVADLSQRYQVAAAVDAGAPATLALYRALADAASRLATPSGHLRRAPAVDAAPRAAVGGGQ